MSDHIADYFDSANFREQGHQVVDLLADFLDQSVSHPRREPAEGHPRHEPAEGHPRHEPAEGHPRHEPAEGHPRREPGAQQTPQELAERVLDFRDANELYQYWKNLPPGDLSGIELFAETIRQSIRLHHPRYMGHQISPPAPIAALAGLVSDTLNNGMGVYEMGMAGTVLERVVVERTGERFGFGGQAGGVLTSGGSLGNLTGLLAARNAKMPEVLSHGQTRLPAILVSGQAHYCVQRAVGIMGFGKDGLVPVPCNSNFQMDVTCLPDLVRQTRQAGRQVIAVVGSACSTATGAYDDLRAIGEFCRQQDLWFHVDGAHGAAAAFSQKYRHLVDGIELADSVVLDFHKLLLTPALATAVVFRDSRQGYGTFSQKAEYLFSEDDQETQWHNLALRTFECTKFMMSLKIYSIFAEYGERAWDANVTRLYDLARTFARRVQQTEGLGLLVTPESNIVCYRYLTGDETRRNQVNREIRERLLRDGKFYIVQTTIDGQHWLRSTFGSATTTENELQELLEEVVRTGNSIERAGPV